MSPSGTKVAAKRIPGRKRVKSPRKSGKGKKTRKLRPTILLAASGLLAAVSLLLFLLPRSKSADQTESGAKVPSGLWRYGIDISHNNEGPIVWDSLFVMTDVHRRTVRNPFRAKDIKPVSFVFIKATEGERFLDRDFSANWRNARKSGIRRGAYHFFRSSKDGEIQARHFVRTVGTLHPKDLPPVLDIETIHRGCSRDTLNARALQWLEHVEKHYGRRPVVYTSATFARDLLDKEITGRYPVWVAHYGREAPDFEGWIWWQFTDRAVVKGVPGKVDLNVMRMNQKLF